MFEKNSIEITDPFLLLFLMTISFMIMLKLFILPENTISKTVELSPQIIKKRPRSRRAD